MLNCSRKYISTAVSPTICRYVALAIVLVLASSANGDKTFIETFENGSNVGQWSFGNTYYEQIEDTGGNPGAFLYNYLLITHSPMAGATDSIFTGDYRANQVTSVGIDFITIDEVYGAFGVPAAVILVNTGEDPHGFRDNWGVYCLSPLERPAVGEGWVSYDYQIPSQATSWPDGWNFIRMGPDAPTDPDWSNLITDVTYLNFVYHDPSLGYVMASWAVGMDNSRITFVPEPTTVSLMAIGCITMLGHGPEGGDSGVNPLLLTIRLNTGT